MSSPPTPTPSLPTTRAVAAHHPLFLRTLVHYRRRVGSAAPDLMGEDVGAALAAYEHLVTSRGQTGPLEARVAVAAWRLWEFPESRVAREALEAGLASLESLPGFGLEEGDEGE